MKSQTLLPLRVLVIILAITAVAVPAPAAEGDRYEVEVERGVAAKMRDGVTLRADIYRPKAEGKFPVLLQRTPYDKRGGVDAGAGERS